MEKMKVNIRSLRVTIPLLLAVLLLGMTPVLAQIPLPMTVYGYVFVDGTPAGAGLNVYAKNGTAVVTQDTTDAESHYLLSISPTSGLDDGTPIDLWVEEENVTRITLAYWDILEVDLTISEAPSPPENEPPVADANGPYTGTEGQPVTFDGSASTDPDGTIVSYYWDFGDLNTGTGVSPTHTYAEDGTYTVTLTVTDNDDATDTDTTTATIADTEPTAEFSGTPTTGTPPLTVSFTDLSTSYDGIVSWSWIFGDGGTSTDRNPTHTYDAEGTYTVTLTVEEADGDPDQETKTDYITVSMPDFTITVSPSSRSVVQGESTTATVTITSIVGYSEIVLLSASGQPTEVSVSLDPESGTPTFTSTMTINVGENAAPGTYSITITGTGADQKIHTATYRLTVTAPEEEKPVGGTFGPVNMVYLALVSVAQNWLVLLAASMLIAGICVVLYRRRKG